MTRKDYVAIAAALNAVNDPADGNWAAAVSAVAEAIADTMAADNPRFDRKRFLDACGVQS